MHKQKVAVKSSKSHRKLSLCTNLTIGKTSNHKFRKIRNTWTNLKTFFFFNIKKLLMFINSLSKTNSKYSLSSHKYFKNTNIGKGTFYGKK